MSMIPLAGPIRLARLAVLAALPLRALLAAAPLALLLVACAATEGAYDDGPPGAPAGAPSGGPLTLARTDDRVKTVQLHPTAHEAGLPVLSLEANETLTLSFDLLEDGSGRPLSVFFYHTDRTGRRDLVPSEYLRSFLSDDIRDYRTSGPTELRYVHYTYEFPNPSIGFLVSGNYVLRVTEQGQEGAVLFERTFFVSEEAAEVQLAFQTGFSGGATVLQPVAQVRPGPRLSVAQTFDYAVCFARNGRFDQTRCAQDPSLLGLALFQFYLDRADAFAAERPYYEVDLGLLQIGPQITSVDYGASPDLVVLDRDYARFGNEVTTAGLTGQPVVAAVYRGGGPPATDAQYVTTRFRYVPVGERPAAGPVLLTGAFNGWQLDPALAMTWNPEVGHYEGELLLKQGLYLYQYVIDDPAAAREANLLQPALYTALVYLRDPIRLTDRLVAVRSAVGQ